MQCNNNKFVKLQETEEEERVTGEGSVADDEKDNENEKGRKWQRNQVEEEDDEEEEEEEEDEEDEEAVTEEDEEDEEEEKEDEKETQDNKFQLEPLKDFRAPASPMLLRPQRVEPLRVTPPPPPVDPNMTANPTVVDEALQRVLSNDSDLTEVNLNNIDDISQVCQ